MVQHILEVSPKRIVYVSCNPATQARDMALMADDYKITKVIPVDLFPHTYHIESIAVMEKIEKPMLANASYKGGYAIELEFANGENKVIDMQRLLDRAPFEELVVKDKFSDFISHPNGITWANGAEIDTMSLYELSDDIDDEAS
jgi:hypothetical protein